MMKPLHRLTLVQHNGPYENWPQDTELLEGGISTGKKVPGYVLEAQYEHAYGLLLVTSWDCPYEEALTFLLLSHELDVRYEKTVGAAYASVRLHDHEPINDDTILFRCDGNLDILLTVKSANSLTLTQRDRRND